MARLKQGGVDVDRFLERESGGVHHKAAVLADLGSAVYGAHEEWRYIADDHEGTTPEMRLVALLAPLKKFLDELSILPDGGLTFDRVCDRCGGAGSFPEARYASGGIVSGEDPCTECGGRGSVDMDPEKPDADS